MSKWPGESKRQKTTFGDLNRSQLMSKVRSKGNRTTELKMLKLLKAAGLSGWRRHLPLPGTPDFGWRHLKIAVFIDGCFWHGHACGRNLSPKTNDRMWHDKFEKNKRRDKKITRELRRKGWSVIRIWECELAKDPERTSRRIKKIISLKSNKKERQNLS